MNPPEPMQPFHAFPLGVQGPERATRVAIVSTQRRWHGGEEQALLLAEGLRRRGHTCAIFARRGGKFAERLREEGFPVFTFAGRGRSPQALWSLRKTLAEFSPEILHYNDPHAMVAAGIASTGLAIPVRLAARRVDFRLKSVSLYRLFCDSMICVSRAVAEICREAGYPADRLHLVHDGVDPARMLSGNRDVGRRSLQLSDHHQLLLCVAKLTEHKGHQYLLDAMPAVVRRHPEVVLALAGEGELRDELEAQVQRLGVESHVRFLGYRNDIPDLMAAADRMVVSSHMEGLCSSIIDAMLIGCPVIGTRAGGIPDLLSHQNSSLGWLVPPRDSDALANAVTDSLESPEQSIEFARLARERAWRDLTHESMVNRTISIYLTQSRRACSASMHQLAPAA